MPGGHHSPVSMSRISGTSTRATSAPATSSAAWGWESSVVSPWGRPWRHRSTWDPRSPCPPPSGPRRWLVAEALPANRQVPWQLAPNGLPAALADFAPTSAQIRPIERGCGLLEARHPDGRQAMLLFDTGTEDEWGP